MFVKLNLQAKIARWLLVVATGLACGLFASTALIDFIIKTVAAVEFAASREHVEAAITYFPNVPQLHARLAAKLVESKIDETQDFDSVAETAVLHATQASKLAPHNYENYLLLAVASEMKGDLVSAETALRKAISLAPQRLSLLWRLGNYFLREGKTEQASEAIQRVVEAEPAYLPEAIDLLWQATDGRVDILTALAGKEPQNKLMLARFLVAQSQYEAAAELCASISLQPKSESAADREAEKLKLAADYGRLLDSFISAGNVALAGKLWRQLLDKEGKWGPGTIWNGGFETASLAGLGQFDWSLKNNQRLRISIEMANPHRGRNALKVTYLGKDTTRLDEEIRQLALVEPGRKYQLECYVKTEALASPDGPHLAVVHPQDKKVIAATPQLPAGSSDWQPLRLEFKAPTDFSAVLICVKQTPQFSYTEPTRGAVWFDDFSLTEK